MDIYAKLLNKIFTNEIQHIKSKTFQHEQVGFIPGMQVWFNIWKYINEIKDIEKLKGKKNT